MYLGHPTDNVRIESLKKCDAWKQSMSATMVKLFSGLGVTTAATLSVWWHIRFRFHPDWVLNYLLFFTGYRQVKRGRPQVYCFDEHPC